MVRIKHTHPNVFLKLTVYILIVNVRQIDCAGSVYIHEVFLRAGGRCSIGLGLVISFILSS